MAENYFGLTDTGRMRSNNEDIFIAKTVMDDQYIAACVIDGVGGYEGGEVAARLAHDAIISHLTDNSSDIFQLLNNAVSAANNAIFVEKKSGSTNGQMACVLTLAFADIAANKFYYAHVGDTRLYLLRDHSLVKVTRDHSFVGFLEDSGRLSEEAAMRHPKRNEINKALGFSEHIVAADYIENGESPFLPGDTLLLCSDGLSDMVSNNSMTAILNTGKSLSVKGQLLIDAANKAGGTDNITVVLVQNNKPVTQHTATKPAVAATTNGSSKADTIVSETNKKAAQVPVANNQKKKAKFPILTVLLLLILAAVGWLVYQNYHNSQLHEQELRNTLVQKNRNPAEQLLLDSVNGTRTKEVFMLTNAASLPVTLTDTLTINRDTLHIIGNGAVLVSDTAYKGAAFIMSPSCRYLLLDSLVLQNFDIGVLAKNNGLHLKNVQFKNCRIPVQYNVSFPDRPVINGHFADTIFYNSDSAASIY